MVSRAGTDPFLAQRTINTCCKWRESTCAFIQCGQLQHPIQSILPSHLLRTSSYMNFFRIQCNFILFKYTHCFFFSFLPLFLFYFIYFCIFIFLLLVFFMFRDVPGCSKGAVPKSGTGTQGREFGDVGRGDARCRTRGSDIGDVNKTYRCSWEKKLFLHEHSFQFTVNHVTRDHRYPKLYERYRP